MRRKETSNPDSYRPPRDGSSAPFAVELLGLALLGLALFAAFNIIEAARWFNNLPPLIVPILLSLGLGHFLLRRGAPWMVHVPAVLGLGLAVAFGLGLWRLSGGAAGGLGIFILALSGWTSYLTLLLAYRGPSPVLLALPGLLVMVISLAFLPSDYFFRLPLLLLASAPALAHFHLQRWGGGSRLALRLAPLAAGLALMGGAVAFTWSTPSPSDPIRPAAADRLLEEPLYDFWESTADIFNKIPNRKDSLQFNLHPTLPFTGPIAQGEDILMVVKAQEPRKWRYRVYESYSRAGWSRIPDAERVETSSSPPQVETLGLLEREEVTIGVRLRSTNTHMASAGIPLEASISSLSEISPQPSFSLDLDADQSSYLPPDVNDLRDRVLENRAQDEEFNLDRELRLAGLKALPGKGEASQEVALDAPLVLARVQDTVSPTTALMFPKRQSPPRSYVTVGSVSTANTLALREAEQEYPSWVTDRYLQLPPDFSPIIKDLARDLSAGHDNPFDIAMSIQDFLHTLSYSTDVVPPPPGVDPVEWFITVQRVGFCNYYASAMITMLRSLGVPARLVVGFAPGDWDEQRGAWLVRSKHYHAWPEVYFPQYGWVEFEPTPPGVQPSLEQLGFTAPNTIGANDLALLVDEECFFDPLACETFEPDTSLEDFDFSQFDQDNDLAAGLTGDGNGGIPGFALWLGSFLGLAAVAILGAKLYMTYLTSRLGRPAATYATMSAMAGMGGVPRASHFTHSEFASQLAQRLPEQSDSIGQVVRTYEVSRYSRDKQVDQTQGERLKASWKSLRWALLRLIARRLLPQRFFNNART